MTHKSDCPPVQSGEILAVLDELVQFFDENELLLEMDVRIRLRPVVERARKQLAAAKERL